MDGLMMDQPLLISSLLWRAEHGIGDGQGSDRRADGGVASWTHQEVALEARRLAQGLLDNGLAQGQVVSSMAWNTREFLSAYFAVPSVGGVLHTVNHRMTPEQIAFTLRKVGSRVVLVDADLLPLFREVDRVLVEEEGDSPFDSVVLIGAPAGDDAREVAWDDLVAGSQPIARWPQLDERSASGICFTSATTGPPKAVVYTHRSTVLHAMSISAAGGIGINPDDAYLLATNMSHVNGWGVPYAAILQGARIVLPGAHPTPADLVALVREEEPTVVIGAPTVVAMLRQHVTGDELESLHTAWLGGSAPPASLAEWLAERGIGVGNGWGMTETSPMMTYHPGHESQGRPLPLAQLRIVGDTGEELPWDGLTVGDLQVRSPWVASEYLDDERTAGAFGDGWLRTGDLCVIHPDGRLQVRDRSKDLIKSGGEWISSIELEHALMLHPQIDEAAVIGVPDEVWLERPIAWVTVTEGCSVADEDLRTYLGERFPRFWVPDRFERVEAIPKTSVGKLDKAGMRRQEAERTP